MKNEFIPYEEALALKEMGFDEPCLGWYLPEIVDKGNVASVILGSYMTNWTKFGDRLSAPTYSQAFRWFREKYMLYHSIEPLGYNMCLGLVGQLGNLKSCNTPNYGTYEEAELACLKKLIQIVKEKL